MWLSASLFYVTSKPEFKTPALDSAKAEFRSTDTAPDVTHEAGISAILRGLERKKTRGYYIQTSGAALIWDEPGGSKLGTRIWDDVKDIEAITSMLLDRAHRSTDKVHHFCYFHKKRLS